MNLLELSLRGTDVSDAGLIHLGGSMELRVLDRRETGVNGTGLAHLEGLTGLQRPHIGRGAEEGAGVRAFRLALPGVRILHGSRPDLDLEELADLGLL